MDKAKLQIIVWFFLTVSTIITYKVISQFWNKPAPELRQAQIGLELEQIALAKDRLSQLERNKLQLQRSHLKRDADLWFYGTIGVLSSVCLSVIIIASGIRQAKVKKASVHTYKIGQYNEVVVHERDLSLAAPVAMGLMNAEQLKQMNGGIEKAFQLYTTMAEVQSKQIRALMGRKGMNLTDNQGESAPTNALPAAGNLTFAELLNSEMIAPGKPLIMGFHQGQPEYRDIKNLKSVAIAGWQGSGKTSSTAYMIGSSVLAYGVRVYVVDPHKTHPEGLYMLIKPLESTGLVTVINPFDTPRLITDLNTTLDRRLRGDESSDQGILFVIDELAKLAKMDFFDGLVTFLERCTEETRKANIIFLGCSTKWTARHFKGRADIRGCMNSALIHKCKPSQAELLLEDSKEKKLVEHLQRPGDAILVTDYAGAKPISMPFCTRADMQIVAAMVGKHPPVIEIASESAPGQVPAEKFKEQTTAPVPVPQTLTPAMLAEKLQTGWKQREIERQTGINQSKISNFKNGNQAALSEAEKRLIFDLLFPDPEKSAERADENQSLTMPTLLDNQLMQ